MYMVQAMIRISEDTNHVLNIVKAKYKLKDKSQAIEKIALAYKENLMEPRLRPEYEKELRKIDKGKFHKFKDVEELKELVEDV